MIRLAGAQTLFRKEILRFWNVGFQTVAAPVLTAVMYLLIFGHVLEDKVQVFDGVGYTSFLIPGLVMMSVLQNSFANSSSSLVQSKVTGPATRCRRHLLLQRRPGPRRPASRPAQPDPHTPARGHRRLQRPDRQRPNAAAPDYRPHAPSCDWT